MVPLRALTTGVAEEAGVRPAPRDRSRVRQSTTATGRHVPVAAEDKRPWSPGRAEPRWFKLHGRLLHATARRRALDSAIVGGRLAVAHPARRPPAASASALWDAHKQPAHAGLTVSLERRRQEWPTRAERMSPGHHLRPGGSLLVAITAGLVQDVMCRPPAREVVSSAGCLFTRGSGLTKPHSARSQCRRC